VLRGADLDKPESRVPGVAESFDIKTYGRFLAEALKSLFPTRRVLHQDDFLWKRAIGGTRRVAGNGFLLGRRLRWGFFPYLLWASGFLPNPTGVPRGLWGPRCRALRECRRGAIAGARFALKLAQNDLVPRRGIHPAVPRPGRRL
jgi:hypothetical protein